MGHDHFVVQAMRLPIEFIETDLAAVQLMFVIEVSIYFVVYAIDIEFSIANAITHTTD